MEEREKILLWLRLSQVKGLGAITIYRLFQHFQDIERIFSASENQISEIGGIKKGVIQELKNPEYKEWAKKELDKAEKLGVELVALDSEDYPENLAQIPDPPAILYIKGKLKKEDKKAVAIVGSRNNNEYGEVMAKRIGSGLAKFGITVISGMARGIDSISQQSALDAGGRSVAVLGSGVDVIYPEEMAGLYQRLIEQGAVISEFPLGTGPQAQNFPNRNRIISGLSMGVVVVQATNPKSGALITARLALEQNRGLYAVPGNAGTIWSKETNNLIKQGAILVESAEDLVSDLYPALAMKPEQLGPLFGAKAEGSNLTEPLENLYSLIPEPEEGSVEMDLLIRKSGLEANLVQSFLVELELYGLIEKLPGGKWRKKQIAE